MDVYGILLPKINGNFCLDWIMIVLMLLASETNISFNFQFLDF